MAQEGQSDSPPTIPGTIPVIAVSLTTDRSSKSGDAILESKSSGVKRVMEKTANKIARENALLSQSQPALPQPGHRRMFSLTRGKGKERKLEGAL